MDGKKIQPLAETIAIAGDPIRGKMKTRTK